MHRVPTLWKANTIAFISSFCVMVIELIAARILAPYIGVSLYTWTSIIGIILAGIALGNYIGGKIADKYASPLVLVGIFFIGGLATIAILPMTKLVTSVDWFSSLPLMLNFVIKISGIFFLPAIILSMVSPVVIKITLADLGETGGVVGTIYACSTVGAILGTFLTGFYFILWFGISMIVWLVGAALILTGILSWFLWKVPGRWHFSSRNFTIWMLTFVVITSSIWLFQKRDSWQEHYTKESNYYNIRVYNQGDVKVLVLDHLIHSYVTPDNPTALKYDYLKIFTEIIKYASQDNPAPKLLHLGGGGYSLPRYMETVYPESVNEVAEIDPAVTQVAHDELGLPVDTSVKTFNQDTRLFLIQRKSGVKYDFVVGDVFNDFSTPYHLTTLEFDRLVKSNMAEDGIYMINIIDDYRNGRYMPSFIYTLERAFNHVYLFSPLESLETARVGTFVIVATERNIDLADYRKFTTLDTGYASGKAISEKELKSYMAARSPLLLSDNHAPTDILVAPVFQLRAPR